MSTIESRTLEVPGVTLAYDVRGDLRAGETVLMLIGSPMGAAGFGTLAGHFTDRPVITYDPHGSGRSQRTDGRDETAPEDHAEDLHLLIEALGAGPVDVFATSGGAVNALALVAAHPEQVRTLVAHEPPLADPLPDREEVLAASEDIHRTYLQRGDGPAMAKFLRLVMVSGPLPATYADQPAPDPATFGLSADDDGRRDNPLLGQNMPSCTAYLPAYDALAAASTRIVLAYGAESAEQLPGRSAWAVAARLHVDPVEFPGGHNGFLGGEFGQQGKPDEFAATLRAVLTPPP